MSSRNGEEPVRLKRDTAADTRRLSEIAYLRILQGLFDKKVPAGAFVSQGDLVKLLKIPIQPIRDALRVLETEGVVEIHPRSGIQFLKPDLELARSAYQYRTIIESAAARVAAETADADRIKSLINEHRKVERDIIEEGFCPSNLARIDELEELMHGGLIGNLHNPLIDTTARRLKNYMLLLRLDRLVTAPLALRTLREHLEILEAVLARDPDAAEAAVVAHFQAALRRILRMY